MNEASVWQKVRRILSEAQQNIDKIDCAKGTNAEAQRDMASGLMDSMRTALNVSDAYGQKMRMIGKKEQEQEAI